MPVPLSRIRTLMIGVAIVASIVGSGMQIERRTRRFARMAARHSQLATELSRTLPDLGGAPPSLAGLPPDGQAPTQSLDRAKALVLYHRSLNEKYENAACFPWLPVPPDPPEPN